MPDLHTPVPDISVVIPCYNAGKWVGRAIESALSQEGVSVEVIVVDDGSTDDSLDVIRAYGDRILVRDRSEQGRLRRPKPGPEIGSGGIRDVSGCGRLRWKARSSPIISMSWQPMPICALARSLAACIADGRANPG